MKATMCQQCCKSGSSKIHKFIVGRLYVLLRIAHCSQHMATYNMEQPIRQRVTNYSKSLFVVFHSKEATAMAPVGDTTKPKRRPNLPDGQLVAMISMVSDNKIQWLDINKIPICATYS